MWYTKSMKISRAVMVGVGLLVGFVLLVLWLNAGGMSGVKPIGKDEKLTVVASFYPLAYLAEAIGGDAVSVTNVTPSGSEPHDFEPSPRQMILIGKADIFIYNGGGFEPWVTKYRSGAFDSPGRILDMVTSLKGRGLNLLQSGGALNPHVWLDPMLMVKQAEIMRDAFVFLDPLNAELYRANTTTLISSLGQLDSAIREGLRECKKNDIVVSHEAFEYLGRAYDIQVTSIAGISPDEEPSARELSRIADLARSKGVKHIFFETSVGPKLSEVLAREIGGEVLVLNPLESLTVEELQLGEDYVSLMMANLNNLRKALVCQ